MTRSEKLRKLGNAIVAYRGIREGQTGPWLHPPQKSSLDRVKICLARFGILTQDNLDRIDSFKGTGEFNSWLAAL